MQSSCMASWYQNSNTLSAVVSKILGFTLDSDNIYIYEPFEQW